MLFVGGVVLLVLCWLVRALGRGDHRELPALGASMLGFAAAFVAVRPLLGPARQAAALALACLGAAGAAVGFAGLVWRWYPMAIPTQGLWRLSTTLTYSDAAGLVLGMCLLVALGVDRCPPLVRVTVCLCAGGLLATQSRGAYVAVACACLLVPWRRYVRFAVPLGAGIYARRGSDRVLARHLRRALAQRSGARGHRAARGAVAWRGASPADGEASGPGRSSPPPCWWSPSPVRALHHEIRVRTLAPSDQDRSSEWVGRPAAMEVRPPSWGSGPDPTPDVPRGGRDLRPFRPQRVPPGRRRCRCHRSGPPALHGRGRGRRVARRFDVLSSCAVAALVGWAVGGAFDFDWHLSFVGVLGGFCLGLAARRDAVEPAFGHAPAAADGVGHPPQRPHRRGRRVGS